LLQRLRDPLAAELDAPSTHHQQVETRSLTLRPHGEEAAAIAADPLQRSPADA